jgi:hypothetical protein
MRFWNLGSYRLAVAIEQPLRLQVHGYGLQGFTLTGKSHE